MKYYNIDENIGGKNMKYYNIDENIACTAHGMVHMSNYVPNSATNSYRILGCEGEGGCNA